jgi:SSS family solute:Na+ symporter
MGVYFARRKVSDDEYFLAGRTVPFFAIGLSLLATLLSSLTYISEPGEVWQSGLVAYGGKMIAVCFEAVIAWLFIIPMLMRFKFTSAYEYLGYRFGMGARWLGVSLFSCLVVTWMGFVVLAMAQSISPVTGIPLGTLIILVGAVGTLYTMIGGLRAVIWIEAMQVVLMVGGCLITAGFVAYSTNSTPQQWLTATLDHQVGQGRASVPWYSFDPFERSTVATFALTMAVWYLCTHLGNQMVVQRYFSSADLVRARRSFVVAAVAGLVVNGLLVLAGIAMLYYYTAGGHELPGGLNPTSKRDTDKVFPLFMAYELPPGLAGAVLAAVLAAAMSTIDSAINALAAVLSVERRRLRGEEAETSTAAHSQVGFARLVTLTAGVFIIASAFVLDRISADRNLIEMMPRSFNCFLVPLGGMFLLGFFVPFVGGWAAVAGSVAGFVTAIAIAYGKELLGLERNLSFTLVLPGSLLVMLTVALGISLFDRPPARQVRGLTWFTRHQRPEIPARLIAERS